LDFYFHAAEPGEFEERGRRLRCMSAEIYCPGSRCHQIRRAANLIVTNENAKSRMRSDDSKKFAKTTAFPCHRGAGGVISAS